MWIAHQEGLDVLGQLPDGVDVELFTGDEYPSDPSEVEFWVAPFLAGPQATRPLTDMTNVKVVQLLSAGADVWTPRIPDGVVLCDAKGVHTDATAEWAVTATAASLRGFDGYARAQARREWLPHRPGATLAGKRVLIVGAGDIGDAIARRVVAFGAEPVMVARRPRAGVHSQQELPRLLPDADVVVLIVPLTGDTRGMVDAEFLARMRDGALLVNAARGPVVDTAALIAETGSGRISAALDVTDPEPLPSDSPLWTMPNVLITPHIGGAVHGFMQRAYTLVDAQLRRRLAGEPLHNVVVDGY